MSETQTPTGPPPAFPGYHACHESKFTAAHTSLTASHQLSASIRHKPHGCTSAFIHASAEYCKSCAKFFKLEKWLLKMYNCVPNASPV